ncbi:hypothetical protein ACFRKE_37685, partial [Kitasatospora indigofera]|uniref:hypothetical protein n=1 Tax=Kitasatospora indigofera TaxID=67307 RepID=UPI003676DFDA
PGPGPGPGDSAQQSPSAGRQHMRGSWSVTGDQACVRGTTERLGRIAPCTGAGRPGQGLVRT